MAPPGSRTLPTGSPTNEKLAECALVWDSTIQRMRGGDRGVARSLRSRMLREAAKAPRSTSGFTPLGAVGTT